MRLSKTYEVSAACPSLVFCGFLARGLRENDGRKNEVTDNDFKELWDVFGCSHDFWASCMRGPMQPGWRNAGSEPCSVPCLVACKAHMCLKILGWADRVWLHKFIPMWLLCTPNVVSLPATTLTSVVIVN